MVVYSSWSLHLPPLAAWVPSGLSGFLPQSKAMQLKFIGGSEKCKRKV